MFSPIACKQRQQDYRKRECRSLSSRWLHCPIYCKQLHFKFSWKRMHGTPNDDANGSCLLCSLQCGHVASSQSVFQSLDSGSFATMRIELCAGKHEVGIANDAKEQRTT